jgi:hypothetical protein
MLLDQIEDRIRRRIAGSRRKSRAQGWE